MAILNEAPDPDPDREAPVFDEHEEWPEMMRGCESKPVKLDHRAALANRHASVRTVEREAPLSFDPAWSTVRRT